MRPLCNATLVILSLRIGTALGGSLYVAPSGSDSNPGTIAKPLRTLARAVAGAGPGDTIVLKDGTYGNEGHISDGTGGWHGYASPVAVRKAGTPTAWITIQAEHRGKATLDC